MKYEIVSTGSSGNAVILDGCILIDCGVPFSWLGDRYRELQLVLLTHIHGDHFAPSTLRRLAYERPSLRFACGGWLTPHLLDAGVPARQIDVLECGKAYDYPKLGTVIPFALTHNVPNCGWKVWRNGERIFYATDTGNLNGIYALSYDLYLVEANYDEEHIKETIAEKKANGEYIYERRVLRDHLSQAQADDWLYQNMGARSTYVYMHCHRDPADAVRKE